MANVKISDLTAAASVGRSDLFEIEQSGPSSKKATAVQILRAGLAAPPLVADFPTQSLQSGTLTVSDTDDGIAFYGIPRVAGSDFYSYLARSAPATPYTVTAKLNAILGTSGSSSVCIGIMDGATTKMVTLDLQRGTGTISTVMQRWTNAATFLSAVNSWSWEAVTEVLFRFAVTSTTITGSISLDGNQWVTIGSTALSDAGTGTRVMFGVRTEAAAARALGTLRHFAFS